MRETACSVLSNLFIEQIMHSLFMRPIPLRHFNVKSPYGLVKRHPSGCLF